MLRRRVILLENDFVGAIAAATATATATAVATATAADGLGWATVCEVTG